MNTVTSTVRSNSTISAERAKSPSAYLAARIHTRAVFLSPSDLPFRQKFANTISNKQKTKAGIDAQNHSVVHDRQRARMVRLRAVRLYYPHHQQAVFPGRE